MSSIDWNKIRYFDPTKDNFSEDPNEADPALIYAIDEFRHILGRSVYPSPVKGALARMTGSVNSRHYAVGRKTDAIDVFPSGDIKLAWLVAVTSGLFGGVGLYPFTHFKDKPWPMLHLDMRPFERDGGKDNHTLLWLRDDSDSYWFPQRSERHRDVFFKLLDNM